MPWGAAGGWQWYQGLRSHRLKFGAKDGETGISAASALHKQLCTPAEEARWGKGRNSCFFWRNVLKPLGHLAGQQVQQPPASPSCPQCSGGQDTPAWLCWSPPSAPFPWVGEGSSPIPSSTRSFPGQHLAPGDAIPIILPPCDAPGRCLGQDGWEAPSLPCLAAPGALGRDLCLVLESCRWARQKLQPLTCSEVRQESDQGEGASTSPRP